MERRLTMASKGTVRWFNRSIGAGFIRTDEGENVMFLNSAIRDFDTKTVREGLRVSLDILESQYGFSAVNVRSVDAQG
jgi:cold shock CspA family protein